MSNNVCTIPMDELCYLKSLNHKGTYWGLIESQEEEGLIREMLYDSEISIKSAPDFTIFQKSCLR